MKQTPFILALATSLSLVGCQGWSQQSSFVSADDAAITYIGRIGDDPSGGKLIYWSGSSVKMHFEGESISVKLADENGGNDYNVILDGGPPSILSLTQGAREYTLAEGLAEGAHTLELFKRSEWDRGATAFYGFRITGDPKLLPPPPKQQRKIEFYGNSITAGYAVEDSSGRDSPAGTFTNHYLSYAAITARYFGADHHCTCRSGIGVMVGWVPDIMPEIYDRIDPTDPASKWDFSEFQPDIVVVNLFQNDSWLTTMPDHPHFQARFGTRTPSRTEIIGAYRDFIKALRAQYPHAYLIGMLGNMDVTRQGSVWPTYIREAVDGLEDEKVFAHFVPYKQTGGHPSIAEQAEMASSLIAFIEGNIGW